MELPYLQGIEQDFHHFRSRNWAYLVIGKLAEKWILFLIRRIQKKRFVCVNDSSFIKKRSNTLHEI